MFKIFTRKAIALEVLDEEINLLAIKKIFSKNKVTLQQTYKIEAGIVKDGEVKDKKKIISVIEKIFSKNKINPKKNKVVFVVPDRVTYTHVFNIEKSQLDTINSRVEEEITENVPCNFDELIYFYKTNPSEDGKFVNVFVYCFKKDLINKWKEIFNLAGLKVDLFDLYSFSLLRAINPKESDFPVLIVDIKKDISHMFMYSDRKTVYSAIFFRGRDYLVDSVSRILKIDKEKVKDKVIKTDITKDEKVKKVIRLEMFQVLKGFDEYLDYFKSLVVSEAKTIVFIGEAFSMKWVLNYLKKQVNTKNSILIKKNRNTIKYLPVYGAAILGVSQKESKNTCFIKIENDQFVVSESDEVREGKKKSYYILFFLLIIAIILGLYIILIFNNK